MYTVAALYHFTRFEDPAAVQGPLRTLCHDQGVTGTLLLAQEGINGTIAGVEEAVLRFRQALESRPKLAGMEYKDSYCEKNPFPRWKVELKDQVIQYMDKFRPKGEHNHLSAAEWHALLQSGQELTVLDTRNRYETKVGTFKNAIDPEIDKFTEFTGYLDACDLPKDRTTLIFCTGGIRCEKSTAYLKERGFDEVYHLQGGILKYLEKVPENESLWQGECFVFDNRVTVDHNLNSGSYDQCHACRMPITEHEKTLDSYIEGVSCLHCHNKVSEQQIKRFAQRQKQVKLAKARGESHIGSAAQLDTERRRLAKKVKKQAATEKNNQKITD